MASQSEQGLKYRVRLHYLFRSDVDDYANWLDRAVPGLGDEFAAAVGRALDTLERRPLSHAVVFDEFRRVLIPRFRAVIPFLVDGDAIYVAGVVHGARDLGAWMRGRFSTDDE